MIEIQRPEQFRKAAERLRAEPQRIERYEPGLYRITNKVKNHTYYVRVIQQDGKTFMRCGCEAGTPTKGGRRIPMVCKHVAALIIYKMGLREMRRAASH
jgi:hypothetical protein